MPRTKGAHNIVNTKELLAENKRLKETLAKNDTSCTVAILKTSESVNKVPEIQGAPVSSNSAIDVKIKVPQKAKSAAVKSVDNLKHTFGCGNKLCQYENDERFSVCPNCGVTNTWQT